MNGNDRKIWLKRLQSLEADQADTNKSQAVEVAAAIAPHVPMAKLEQFEDGVMQYLEHPVGMAMQTILAPLIAGNTLALWTGGIQFQDSKSLYTIVDEILVKREYAFKTTLEKPLVIDAGANIGLATYYAKRMCKADRVICFEPNPACHELLCKNVENNKFSNVEIHQAALAKESGELEFFFPKDAPLAGSLMPRNTQVEMECQPVKTLKLSDFLDQPVSFLKLDIEGAEADVLEECEGKLDQVENLFCEVHPVAGEQPSLLLRTLGALERAGFYVHVSRSPWSERSHSKNPLFHASRTYSLSVYATRLGQDGKRIAE